MTFLLAYRSRPNALRSFLTTLAATTSDHPVQLVIVDLGLTAGETAAVIADHKGHLHVDYHWINHRGIFHKTKALNFGLTQIDTELVTLVDVDALFKHDIVAEIDSFFSDEKNRAKKIGWQVRHIDPQLSSKIMDDPSVFNEINLQRFRHHNEIIDGVVLGNSHMTIQRQLLLDVGGFDERYVG
jgi:hypothetical protein